MREPHVFPAGESPFSPDVPPLERRRRMLAAGADVVTDEDGAVIDFLSEDDVEGVLNDPRFASVAMPTLRLSGIDEHSPVWDLWQHLMFAHNGDEHRRIRNVVAREFSPRRVDRYRPAIEAAADDLVDVFPRRFDLWSSFAYPFAARVTGVLVGIPPEDTLRAATWAFDLARAFFPFMSADRVARAERSALEICDYMDGLLAARRADPRDDLVSMLASPDVATVLSVDEVRALAANMVFAGLEATAKGVCTGAYFLIEHDQLPVLAEHPELVPTAVAEVLRFSPPAQSVARYTPVDMVCQEVQLRAGQVASANIVAACRDPRRHRDPDRLDIGRDPGKQLAFGAGPHYCLGANLAKLGLGIAFERLAERCPTMAIADPEAVEWDYEGFAGIVGLPVVTPGV